jgi:hypothetical protein
MTHHDPDHRALREAFGASWHEIRGGRQCLPWERLWDSAHGTLSRRDEEPVLLHLGECSACAAAWRMAREMALDAPDGRVPVPARRWRPSRWIPIAAAAALLVVVGAIGVQVLRDRTPSAPVYRSPGADWLHSELAADQVLPRDHCLLRWTPGPEGTTYQVRVMSEDHDALARGRRLDRAEFLIPPAALEGVPSGGRIFWQVTVRLPDGRTVDSETFDGRVE